jgi:RNA polymerase sigma-70 factor, ECF subfamily
VQNNERPSATIDRLRSLEERAWDDFGARYGERLHRYFHRLGVRRHEAEDLCQETLGAVFRRIGAVRDPQCLDAWVLAIARNLLRSRRRRDHGLPELTSSDGGLASLAAEAPAGGDFDDLRRAVRVELRSLPPSTRRLLEVRLLEGRSSSEAWLLLGLTPEQQRRRLYVAMKELRRRLAESRPAAAAYD